MARTWIVAGLLLMVSVPAMAQADTQAEAGALVGLRELNAEADQYNVYRGGIWVLEKGKVLREYRWGGSACTGFPFSEDEIANLRPALGSKKIHIIPIHKFGQGGSLCLTQYILIEKKYVDDVDVFPFGN